MANRTLQFYGYAYGNTPVQLNAHINGQVVFSGTVTTTDQPLPIDPVADIASAPLLFSVEDSPLFPTEFSGSLPMTVSVATGNGIALGQIFCNYMETSSYTNAVIMENSSISNLTLTVGSVSSGNITKWQLLTATDPAVDILAGTQIVDGSGSSWTVSLGQNVPSTTIQGSITNSIAGNATTFVSCYRGTPTNTDNTADPRSSVTIDGVAQNPNRNGENGTWTWVVPQGSTIGYNLNVGLGNVA